MHEEPYRWLEAVANRRDYIKEQLKGGTPVFALSRPEGILLLGVGSGQSKVFEIFDRHAMAALGHPVDIERVRQTAIQAAHTEGFQRSPPDVTLRRLISFSLSYVLKAQFEQIFSAPVIAESIFAEVAGDPAADTLVRLHYDGTPEYLSGGIAVACATRETEPLAVQWLSDTIKTGDKLERVVTKCLTLWQAIVDETLTQGVKAPREKLTSISNKITEAALLRRDPGLRTAYHPLCLS